MKRIFGGPKKAAAPGPSMDDVSTRMNERTAGIEKKVDDINARLVKLKAQIAGARTPAAKAAAKTQATRLLKQRKMYENQLEQVGSQQMNLESASFMAQQMKDTADQVAVMKEAKSAISAQMAAVGIDDVEQLQDDMADLYYDHEEMQEILGRSFAVDADVDEDELRGELDLIEDELALEAAAPHAAAAVPAFLEEPELPAAPQGRVEAAAPQQLGAGQM